MYSIIFEKKEHVLPDYNFDIAEKLEALEIINTSENKTYKEKCRALYDFETEIIKDILPEFEKCDPNDIQLLFMSITECYNQPIIEKRKEQIKNSLNNYDFDKISKMADSVEKLK